MEETVSHLGSWTPEVVDATPPSPPSLALAVLMPRIGNQMRGALVHRVCVDVGDQVRPGDALMEVRVDLSDGTGQPGTPISYHQVIARESGTVRGLQAEVHDLVAVGGVLAWIATDRPTMNLRTFRSWVVGIQVDRVFGR